MFENKIINKYDINDVLYVYNAKANRIDTIVVSSITLDTEDEEVKYNYRYYQHEVFALYEDAFRYARKYLSEVFNNLYKNLKEDMKGGEGNASS